MYGTAIERHFAKIGARAKIYPERRWHDHPVTIDIGRDDEGEFFDIAVAPSRLADLRILDTQPQVRHLLLLAGDGRQKSKFLCGHDERHWFVAAVPERAPVSSVSTAFDALKPFAVRLREERLRVKPSRRNRRRNEAFVRQGEWFFSPRLLPFASIRGESSAMNLFPGDVESRIGVSNWCAKGASLCTSAHNFLRD